MMWPVAGMLVATIAASGGGVRNSLRNSGNPDHDVGSVVQPESSQQSSDGVVTDWERRDNF